MDASAEQFTMKRCRYPQKLWGWIENGNTGLPLLDPTSIQDTFPTISNAAACYAMLFNAKCTDHLPGYPNK